MLKSKNKKSVSPSLKGSVLFTVMVVSLILLIVMLATIALAGAASRRAYNEYNDHQTMSTARSVVDSVITSLKKNEDLGFEIVDDLKTSKGYLDVKVNNATGGNLGEGFGTVDNLRFEYVGVDDSTGFNITGSKKPIIKITATVTSGGVTSSYSQYVIGDAGKNTNSTSGGGFVAFGGFESSNGSTNPTVFAPAYIGINNDEVDFTKVVNFKNNALAKETIVNADVITNAKTIFSLGKNEGTSGRNGGITVMGNLISQNPFVINGYTPAESDDTENMSYLYVGGTLNIYNASELGTPDHPINIYCGRLVYARNDCSLNANILCYNTGNGPRGNITDAVISDTDYTAKTVDAKKAYANDSWSYIGNTSSNLVNWASAAFTNTKVFTGTYCTKGNLSLHGKAQFSADVFVEGDLNVSDLGSITVGGNVAVKGNIVGSAEKINTFVSGISGKLYYNGATDGLSDDSKAKIESYSTNNLNDICKKFISGSLKDRNTLESDVVVLPKDAKAAFTEVVDGVTHYKNAKNFSQIKLNTSKVYYQTSGKIVSVDYNYAGNTALSGEELNNHAIAKSGDYDAVITGGCTLAGDFDNVKLLFKPEGEVWVNLYNVYFKNNCEVVVDDSNGNVNFYLVDLGKKNYAGSQKNGNKYEWVPEESAAYEALLKKLAPGIHITVSNWNQETNSMETIRDTTPANTLQMDTCSFVTLKYKEKFQETDPVLNLTTNPTGDDAWMIPGLGIYSGEGSDVYINVRLPSTFTADIYTPSGGYSQNVQGSPLVNKATIKWNGETIKPANNANMQVIGSLMVGTIDILQNDFKLAFVNDGSGGVPDISSDKTYEWTPMPGFADY